MYDKENERITNIYQMLLEMADGNFFYRISRTKKDDNLEALSVLINWLSEEINAALYHMGYVNPHVTYHYLVQSTYILDADGSIRNFSTNLPDFLGMKPDKLLGTNFTSILEKESRPVWQKTKHLLLQNEPYPATLLLRFVTSKSLLIPSICSVFRLSNKKQIGVSLLKAVLKKNQEKLTNIPFRKTVIHRKEDIQLIQTVHDYVLAHKNTSLPSLKELARIFGTNEFKLKVGFKLLFKTTIHQLHTNERLKRAHLLIENTSLSLKKIAFMIGYRTYPSFSRAFKNFYGYNPKSIYRKV